MLRLKIFSDYTYINGSTWLPYLTISLKIHIFCFKNDYATPTFCLFSFRCYIDHQSCGSGMIFSAPYAIFRIVIDSDTDPILPVKFNLCIFTVQYLQRAEYRGRNRPFYYKIAKTVQFFMSRWSNPVSNPSEPQHWIASLACPPPPP
jgi:hypothetical protein